jgi:hypothetical protein
MASRFGSPHGRTGGTGVTTTGRKPTSSPDEFRSSLQSDLDAVIAAGGGWEELTHETDPASLFVEMKSWISDSLMPAAQAEVDGNPAPPLAGERRSE